MTRLFSPPVRLRWRERVVQLKSLGGPGSIEYTCRDRIAWAAGTYSAAGSGVLSVPTPILRVVDRFQASKNIANPVLNRPFTQLEPVTPRCSVAPLTSMSTL